jgi:hypothetical protein
MKRAPRIAVLVAILALLAGCATSTPHRLAPQFQERLPAIKTVAVVPADVKVYELGAGGTRELMDDWSEKARENVLAAVRKHLGQGGSLALKDFDPKDDAAVEEEVRDVRALYEAVSASVLVHTYGPETTFQTKKERFDYSLGPLPKLGEAAAADALLFVYAVDHISSGGRVALNVFTVLLAAAAGVVVVPAGGHTMVTAALVDARTGDLLWFNARATRGGHDLRDATSAESIVADTFAALSKDTASGTAATVPRR